MSTIEDIGDEPIGGFRLPRLFNLVYCSRATSGIDDAAVRGIIAVAQRSNPAKGITGLLVFGGGFFFQWLEGPRENVSQLMANIARDDRHEAIVPLSQSEEVRERLFPDWAMELVTTEDIRAVLEDALDTAEDEKNVQALQRFLQQLDADEQGGTGAN